MDSVVLVAPRGDMETVVMGNDERTVYRIRNRVVEVHKAHVSALKMMGFYEPKSEKPIAVAAAPEPTLTAEQAAALLNAAKVPEGKQEAQPRSK